MKFSVRVFYLYSVAFLGLILMVMGSIRLVDLGLKTVVFPKADDYSYMMVKPAYPEKASDSAQIEYENMRNQEIERTRQRQLNLISSLSLLIIGIPLYLFHWSLIQKERH